MAVLQTEEGDNLQHKAHNAYSDCLMKSVLFYSVPYRVSFGLFFLVFARFFERETEPDSVGTEKNLTHRVEVK